MNFQDGDRVIGHYGNVWTREDGLWYLRPADHRPRQASTDETMEWLLTLSVKTAIIKPRRGKLSKTEPLPPDSYTIKYTLKRSSGDEEAAVRELPDQG